MSAPVRIVLGLTAVAACAAESPPVQAARSMDSASSGPGDSLAVAIPGGAIWYTMARAAAGADGVQCLERTLEIRRGGDTVAVPLLYTRDVPELLDDSTAAARIYRDCAAGDRYRFDLRSGQPTPVR